MRSQEFLPAETVDKLKRLRLLILEKFETQGNFALTIGVPETFISRVLNGRRYLKPDEKQLWAALLKTDLSVFPDPPTFRRNDDICPYYSLEEAE